MSLRICSLLTMRTQNCAKEFVLRYIAIYSFFELHSCLVFPIPTWEGFFLLVRRHYTEAINCLFLLTWQHIIGQILHTDDIKWNVSTYKKNRERSFRFTFLLALAVKWHYSKYSEILSKSLQHSYSLWLLFFPQITFLFPNYPASSNIQLVLSDYSLEGPHFQDTGKQSALPPC